ncbi:MAG: dihydropteroate synthase [Flavobacteriales bacterium]|nr:dihydropteroate synthase [Flavobacteriales bacterium]
MKTNSDKSSRTINCSGKLVPLSTPHVMGILNLTPDSFYDGGKYTQGKNAFFQTEKMVKEGATFIDVGAYSSRPGAKHISLEEELARLSGLSELTKRFPETHFSIDTFRSEVARYGIENGTCIINDISGGELDSEMFETVAQLKVPYICMHMKGQPQTMQQNPTYTDVVSEMLLYFSEKVNKLRLLGVSDIILDPGFGFGKSLEDNYEVLRRWPEIGVLELPWLAGVSRKSMINKVLNIKSLGSLNGTTALNMICLINGANFLRVHDVKEAVETVSLFRAYQGEFSIIANA